MSSIHEPATGDPATREPVSREPVVRFDGAAADSTARRWAAGHVLVAVVIALAVGALLNAQSLLATAQRQPFGWQRDVAVAVASPVASLSAAVGLDRPHAAITSALGRSPDGSDGGAVVDEQPGAGAAQPTARATAEPSDGPSDVAAGPTTPTATTRPTASATPTPTEPAGPMGLDRGPVTAQDPLELYIAGDSMVEIQFGIAVEDLADDTGMVDTVEVDFDRGSGLARPDYIDWPARLARASENVAPDVMLVYFGGNDAQPLEIDGAVHEPTDPEWQAEYRSRVAGLMDQLTEAGHHVYWMGLPIPSGQEMQVKFGILNDIYSSEATQRDGVTYVDMWDLFARPDGSYSEYLVDQDGDEQDMRLEDGIHYSTAGAYRAARSTLARIAEDFDIPEPATG